MWADVLVTASYQQYWKIFFPSMTWTLSSQVSVTHLDVAGTGSSATPTFHSSYAGGALGGEEEEDRSGLKVKNQMQEEKNTQVNRYRNYRKNSNMLSL